MNRENIRKHFTGSENHQELRKKIISLPLITRNSIRHLAEEQGLRSKKNSVAEAVYWILNDLHAAPMKTCGCGKQFGGRFHSILDGYVFHAHCSPSCRSKDPVYKAKLAATNLEVHGHPNNMHGPKIKAKTNVNRLDKYGTIHPTQNPAVFKKTLRSLRSTKEGVLPSGATYSYQGFENFAVDRLLTMYSESQLVIGDPTKIPVIEYMDEELQKLRCYFPDIWIPHDLLLIEVKSEWTLERDASQNAAKHRAAKALGFKHQIWVISRIGDIIKIID